jgi:Lrp/AsnC family leucine-responsive transcriptional regulator
MGDAPHLDAIDLRILDILRRDGRITYQRLSELVHLTPRPCQERVRKLEQAGIIQGYGARIDASVHQRQVIVHAQVALASQSGRAAQQAFEAEARRRPEVLDCWLVSGPFDYLVRLAFPDLEAYRALTSQWLSKESFRIERIVGSPELQTIKSTLG